MGFMIVFVLSSFVLKSYLDRRNEAVLESIGEEAIPLLNNPRSIRKKAGLRSNNSGSTDHPTEIIDQIDDQLQNRDG